MTNQETFSTGRYRVRVTMADAIASLRGDAGERWRGLPETSVSIVFGAPNTPRERALAYEMLARAAWNTPREARRNLELALAADPTFTELCAELGMVYVRLRLYCEAIACLEPLLPAALAETSGIPQLLAEAYVGMGDDVDAQRVLRRAGMSDQRVSGEMRRLRSLVRQR